MKHTRTHTLIEPLDLEFGGVLPNAEVAYTIYGTLSPNRDNVVWVCHALTGGSEPDVWWPGLVGSGRTFNPEKHFIICANLLGSCYGSSGPLSIDPTTGRPYGIAFPEVTLRDSVRAFISLRRELDLHEISVCIGGSMGGQAVLEWSLMEPDVIRNAIIIAANTELSPWGKAFNAAQRMALESDPTWADGNGSGLAGLGAARALAMISYRNYDAFWIKQTDVDPSQNKSRAELYLRHQANKLTERFDPLAYWHLTKAMDSHNVARGRKELSYLLRQVRARTLTIGLNSDILFPCSEQKKIAELIPGARYEEIESNYGHDGFLLEYDALEKILDSFLSQPVTTGSERPLRVGLIGCGTVGNGLCELLLRSTDPKVEIAKIGVRDLHKDRPTTLYPMTTDASEVITDPTIDVIVELTDDSQASLKYALQTLALQKPFITANKRMVADNLTQLHQLADRSGTHVYYEAAVGGSIPIISNLNEHCHDRRPESIAAILNGSSNYILTLMDDQGFIRDQAIAEAKALGFAESDPSLDLEGKDSAYKLSILIGHAFGIDHPASEIPTIGVSHIGRAEIAFARNNQLRIKLIARASFRNGELHARVVPELVAATDPLFHIADEQNGVVLGSNADFGEQLLTGKGAGGHPTALSVLADLDLVRQGKGYQLSLLAQPNPTNQAGSETVCVVLAADLIGRIPDELIGRISEDCNHQRPDHTRLQVNLRTAQALTKYRVTPLFCSAGSLSLSSPTSNLKRENGSLA